MHARQAAAAAKIVARQAAAAAAEAAAAPGQYLKSLPSGKLGQLRVHASGKVRLDG